MLITVHDRLKVTWCQSKPNVK